MRHNRKARDRGGVTVEFGAILPLVLFVVVMVFEALLVATVVERVENAARTGAREASKAQDASRCQGAAQATLPGWMEGARALPGRPIGTDGVACTVQSPIPILWPSVDPGLPPINRTVTMPLG